MNLTAHFYNPIFSKKITGEEMYWHNVVGGSLYIGGSPPISNGADIRMIIVGKDHFMHCGHCERETMMRYQTGKSKGKKMFWSRKVLGILTCCLWPKDSYHFPRIVLVT